MSAEQIYIVRWTPAGQTVPQMFCTGEGLDPINPGVLPIRGVLVQPGSYDEHLFSKGETYGPRAEYGRGDIELNNNDGKLDYLIDLGHDGQQLEILRGSGNDLDAYEVIGTMSIELPQYSEQKIILSIKNGLAEFATQLMVTETFSGDVSDTSIGGYAINNVNGTPDDIGGKYKPLLIGNGGGENFAPPLVNAGKQTFMVSRDQCADVEKVWLGGAELERGTNYATLVQLQNATVPAGFFHFYLGDNSLPTTDPLRGCYFRVGSALEDTVTCRAVAGATAADRTMAQNTSRVLTLQGKTLDATSAAALDATNPAVCGYWCDISGEEVGNVIDAILQGDNGFWLQRNNGTFAVGRLEDPATQVPVTTITKARLSTAEKVRRFKPKDPNGGLPSPTVQYSYNRNYTLQSESELPGIVALDKVRVQQLKNPFSTITPPDLAAVKLKHKTALPFEMQSYFTSSVDANVAALRLQAIRGMEQDHVEITVAERFSRSVNLADVIKLEYDRYSASGADNYLVIGRRIAYGQDEVTLRLWKVRGI